MRRGKSLPKRHSQTSASPSEDKKRKSDVDTAERREKNVTLNQMSNQSKREKKSSQKNKESPAKIVGESDGPKKGLSSTMKTPLPRKCKAIATNDQSYMHLSMRQRTQKAHSSTDNGVCLTSTVQNLTDSRTANQLAFVEQAAAVIEGNGGEVINLNNKSEAVAIEQNGGKIIDSNNQNLNMVIVADAANTAVEVNIIDPYEEKNKTGPVSTVEGIDINNEKNEEKRVLVLEGNAVEYNDQNLPFVKTSSLWKEIESNEIFQAIPQNPHFKMLVDVFPKNGREGTAIGYMVTFSSVVKKITELRFDDSRASIADCLETLAQLEQNGFNVKAIYERLSSLLLKKDEYELLLNQFKEYESKMTEHYCEKLKISEEVDELDKQIKELQEKREMAFSVTKEVEKKNYLLRVKGEGCPTRN